MKRGELGKPAISARFAIERLPTEIQRRVRSLVYTSVDDCRSSLGLVSDKAALEAALERSEELGHKSRATIIKTRLRQLEREEMKRNLQMIGERRPSGIIRCLPSLQGDSKGAREMRLSLAYMESGIIDSIYIALNATPRIEVLHMYLAVGGQIQARLNIAGYESGDARECWDGSIRQPKIWAVCTAPVVRPPEPVKMRGFRGFRYVTEDLW
jgi:hypothetical protein